MNINSRNPLAEKTVSDSLELIKPLFSPCYKWNRFPFLSFYQKGVGVGGDNWSQVVAIGSREKDQAHPPSDLVISRPGLPLTESLHLWCDPNQTPLLSITHRCLHVTSDFAQSSCNSLDILWGSNWMGSSHDSSVPGTWIKLDRAYFCTHWHLRGHHSWVHKRGFLFDR